MLKKSLLSLLAAVLAISAVEAGVHLWEGSRTVTEISAEDLMKQLPQGRIHGRELDNQMLIHNVALFTRHPNPKSVTTAYVGTSHTKIVRPEWLDIKNSVNSSGNSYNEISYGLLLQAEIVRRMFPRLRTVFVETSLLLRRPNRLVLEEDHRRYLPLLKSLLPLIEKLPEGGKMAKEITAATENKRHALLLRTMQRRSDLRLSGLLAGGGQGQEGVPVSNDTTLAGLRPNGERISPPGPALKKEEQWPSISPDNEKVQRLQAIPSWKPWDGLFDLFALWGQAHHIQIVFFQPPVRSDLYQYEVENGLDDHVKDLKRVARRYHLPFIDLNQPELGYTRDGSIFADEDHLETCPGVILLQGALEEGLRLYQEERELFPLIKRAALEQTYVGKLKACPL